MDWRWNSFGLTIAVQAVATSARKSVVDHAPAPVSAANAVTIACASEKLERCRLSSERESVSVLLSCSVSLK